MSNSLPLPRAICRIPQPQPSVYAAILLVVLTMLATNAASAQTFTVLQSFNGLDGNLPGTPILDKAGNLYGTTVEGGPGEYGGFGNVYKLSHTGSGWVLNDLYDFTAFGDGAYPEYGGLTLGGDGTLYGTAAAEGDYGYGTIFNLRPQATFCRAVRCPWDITVLYAFGAGPDGNYPNGKIVFDAAGNMYGTTYAGGDYGYGTVFMATRSGGTWAETVLHSFNGKDEGAYPMATVARDAAGNLYGTTNSAGAPAWGTVFELTPSGSGWTFQVIHSFTNGMDGRSPVGGLVLDSAGNLYGSAQHNGQNFGGTIFELSPSGSGWTFNLLYSLTGQGGPADTLTFDSAGNLYGTTYQDGAYGAGSVFELSPSGGGWTYTDLHDFTGGNDGKWPTGSVALEGEAISSAPPHKAARILAWCLRSLANECA